MTRKKKMIIWTWIIVAIIFLGVFIIWKIAFSGVGSTLHTGTITIGNNTFNVELATTPAEQAQGLSDRESLAPNSGMLFLFNRPGVQNFWMKDMNFPLDMIWIGGGKVLGYAVDAEPQPGASLWSLKIYTSPDYVDTVLEVPAGTVAKDEISIGEAVTVTK